MYDFLLDICPQGADRVFMQIGGILGGMASFFFGNNIGPLLWWLIIFVCIDFISGVVSALKTHSWTSRKCSNGIVRKLLIFVMVALAHGLDTAFASLIQIEIIESITICAYIGAEFGSIIENLERAGYGGIIPPILRQIVSTLNKKIEEKGKTLAGDKPFEH